MLTPHWPGAQAVRTSETSVYFNKTRLHTRRRKNMKSHYRQHGDHIRKQVLNCPRRTASVNCCTGPCEQRQHGDWYNTQIGPYVTRRRSHAFVRSSPRNLPPPLWNPEVHYCVHKTPPLNRMPSQMDPIHILKHYLRTIYVHLSSKHFLSFRVSGYNSVCKSHIS
jgi:hypothetical protein